MHRTEQREDLELEHGCYLKTSIIDIQVQISNIIEQYQINTHRQNRQIMTQSFSTQPHQSFHSQMHLYERLPNNLTLLNNLNINGIPLRQAVPAIIDNPHRSAHTSLKSSVNNIANAKILPDNRKIYFTYLGPNSPRQQQRAESTQKQDDSSPSQWEIKYFELRKEMNEFELSHQKMCQKLSKLKQDLQDKQHIIASLQTLRIQQNTKYQQLLVQNKKHMQSIETLQEQQQAHKNQNKCLLNQIENLMEQINILKSQNLTRQNQRQAERQRQREKLAEKVKKSEKAVPEQRFQQKLARLRGQYQKKQKKYEKLIETKVKQISDLRKNIFLLQQNQRNANQLKDKFEKLYLQKKFQAQNLKQYQENFLLSSQNQKQNIHFYEQKILQLNNIAKEQNEKIQKLQKQKAKMEQLLEKYQQNFKNEEQFNNIQRALDDAKNQMLEKGGISYDEMTNNVQTYYNGKIFQQKLIYELKKDNQKMKDIITRLSGTQPQVIGFLPNASISTSLGSGSICMLMKTILVDTYSKVQTILNQVNISSLQNSLKIKPKTSPPHTKRDKQNSKKNKKRHYKESLIENEEGEANVLQEQAKNLQILKIYIVDLNQALNRLITQLQKQELEQKRKQYQDKQIKQAEQRIQQIIPKDAQLIQFYKNKNKQLEQRIDQLLNLNQLIKFKILESSQAKCKSKQEKQRQIGRTDEYWENQIRNYKEEIRQKQLKNQKLVEKNKKCEKQKEDAENAIILVQLEMQRVVKLLKDKQTVQINKLKPLVQTFQAYWARK